MKFIQSRRSAGTTQAAAKIDRRDLIVGAGAAGAAAAAAAFLHRGGVQPEPAPVARVKPAPAGGYRLTPHVQRYYETAQS